MAWRVHSTLLLLHGRSAPAHARTHTHTHTHTATHSHTQPQPQPRPQPHNTHACTRAQRHAYQNGRKVRLFVEQEALVVHGSVEVNGKRRHTLRGSIATHSERRPVCGSERASGNVQRVLQQPTHHDGPVNLHEFRLKRIPVPDDDCRTHKCGGPQLVAEMQARHITRDTNLGQRWIDRDQTTCATDRLHSTRRRH